MNECKMTDEKETKVCTTLKIHPNNQQLQKKKKYKKCLSDVYQKKMAVKLEDSLNMSMFWED